MSKSLVAALLIVVMVLAPQSAFAQDMSKFAGTIRVESVDIRTAGELSGCSLEYRASAVDTRSRINGIFIVTGSFNVVLRAREREQYLVALLKAGVSQVEVGKGATNFAPHFAYLESKNGTTAKSVLGGNISDSSDFKTYALELDDRSMPILGDIFLGGSLTVGFNRSESGLDVRVPIDLTVADSKSTPNGFVPVRSNDAVIGFTTCMDKVFAKVKR